MPPLQNRPPPLEQVRCSDATFVPSQLVARNDAEWLGDAFLETSHIAIRKDAEAVLRLMNSTGRLVFLQASMPSFPDRLVFRLQDATAGNNKRGTGLVHQGGVGGKDDAALLPSFSLEPRAAGAEPAGLIGS